MATPRPPLPFGLGRSASCPPSQCLRPGVPLPLLGTPLHDQVAVALSALFTTFYATSLRYLGVSEILDWVESNRTVDAWILTGLEQGRDPKEVANEKNLEVGRGAIRSVIKAALEQEDEAWATSLREVGFSSGMSMAYEGIVSQLKAHPTSPLPCLHSLLTPAGLAMLQSAPLQHAFPICPPRPAPSPSSLLAALRASHTLPNPASSWRPHVRRAFAQYHAMVKQVAEEVVGDPEFSREYTLFLESISQPLQLLQLIREDFETEFGEGACRGLLGVGEVGGQNLIQIQDFCAAKRPSELLARVKERVRAKAEKEKKSKILVEKKRYMGELRAWQASAEANRGSWAVAGVEERMELRMQEAERQCVEVEAFVREYEEAEAEEERRKEEKKEGGAKDDDRFRQGSSKDLLPLAPPSTDPFSACAPRSSSPAPQSRKGKGRALTPLSAAARSPARYPSRPPPSPLSRAASPRPPTPLSPSSQTPYTPPPSPPHRTTKLPPPSSLARTTPAGEHEEDASCCVACAAEMLQSTLAPVLAQQVIPQPAVEGRQFGEEAVGGEDEGGEVGRVESGGGESVGKKKPKKKKKGKVPAAVKEVVEERSEVLSFVPLPRYPPPLSCPPDRCTGDTPDHFVWPELDGLLYETCLAGFKYELIDNLGPPLEFIRDKLAKEYLGMGGRLCDEKGRPKEMDSFVRSREKELWSSAKYSEVQAFTQRTLAISMQKLMEVFRAQLGNICICRLSNHPQVLINARHRLTQCELADREIPIQLPAMDQQIFMKWCHLLLRENIIGGSEWEGRDRSYRLADFLLNFTDSFNSAIDRMVDQDPYILAGDLTTLLEWQGGVRTFDAAMRLGTTTITTVVSAEEMGPKPLEALGHLLKLSGEARIAGTPFTAPLAEVEKQKGNKAFAAGEFEKSIVAFATASIILPTNATYWTNAAAARIKIGTLPQYAEAVSDCTLALEYEPQNVKALYRRGTALATLGHWDAAIADLTILVDTCPQNQPAVDSLAWAKRRQAQP